MGAFNEPGGLHGSSVIQKSLVDVFVPFLPLERRHVKMCAEQEFQQRGVVDISEVMMIFMTIKLTSDDEDIHDDNI